MSSRTRIVTSLAVLLALSPPAWAKPCDLDLQVVFINAREAFASHPGVRALDVASFGLLSTAFGAPGESYVVESAMAKLRGAIEEKGLTGTVRQYPASLSGRPYGWTYWDPATPTQTIAVPYVPDLDDYWMLAVHLDDPGRAAVQARKASPALVALGEAFGADVRGMVYEGVFEAMVPDLSTYNLQVLVNTGQGVRCRDVVQRY